MPLLGAPSGAGAGSGAGVAESPRAASAGGATTPVESCAARRTPATGANRASATNSRPRRQPVVTDASRAAPARAAPCRVRVPRSQAPARALRQTRHRRPTGRALHRTLWPRRVRLGLQLGGQLDGPAHAGIVDGIRQPVAEKGGEGRRQRAKAGLSGDELVEILLDLEPRHLLPLGQRDRRVGQVPSCSPISARSVSSWLS